MASVIELFGRFNDPETYKLVILALEIVELLTVVVAKVLVPVNVLLPTRVASVDVSVRLLKDRPIIFEPVKFTVPFWTERLVEVAEAAIVLIKFVLVAKIFVEVRLVPLAEIKPKAPDKVPPVKSK